MQARRNRNEPFIYAGFQSPNFTQVPDDLFDVLLPELSDPELRVLLYIIRRTFGFKKQSDEISLSQMVQGITTKDGRTLDRGVGISKASVARALQGLQTKGIVIAKRNRSAAHGNEPTTYALRFRSDPCLTSETRGVVSAVRQGLVSPADPQYTDIQHTVLSSKENRFKEREGRRRGVASIGQVIRARYPRSRSQETVPFPDEQPVPATQHRRPTERHDVRVRNIAEQSPAIEQVIRELSTELLDEQHLRSNTTQAVRLYARSGLSEAAFVGRLYEARSLTRDRLRNPPRAGRVKRSMAYLFAVLRDLLGLVKPSESGTR